MTDHVEGYELGRVLGRGGSGTVHEARQESTGRAVAVKVLDVDAADGEVARRFAREREAMSTLADHPHIVSILDAGVQDGRPWIAMDLCPSGSLARLDRPLPVTEVLAVLQAVGGALAAAHAQGVLHCDVKPANILLSGFGRPVLSDFGIARLSNGGTRGSTVGGYTLDHVAPEVLDGRRPEARSDVFSLGTTAWQLLAGRPPFRRPEDSSMAVVMRRIQQEPMPALPRRDVPPALVALLTAMTAKQAAARPTAAEAVRRVETIALADGAALGAPLREAGAGLGRAVGPSTGATGRVTGPRTGVGTDHRPDLANLTHAGRPAARAAAPPAVAREHVRPRRDPVVVVALVAVAAVLVGLAGLTTWRLLPAEAAASSTLVTAAGAGTAAPGAPTDVPVALAGGAPAAGGAGLFGPSQAGLLGTARSSAPVAGRAAAGKAGTATVPGGTTAGGSGAGTPVKPPTTTGVVHPVEPLQLRVTHQCHRNASGQCSLAAGPISIQIAVLDATGSPFTQGYCSDRYTVTGPAGLESKGTGTCNRGPITLSTATWVPGNYITKGNANPREVWFGSSTETINVAP